MKNLVFLLDFDDTLFNNDQLLDEFHQFVSNALGPENSRQFWNIAEQLRTELGYVDYLGTIQRYRVASNNQPDQSGFASFLFDYPYISQVYPDTYDVLHHLKKWGPTVILTDGDIVFQPYKIKASGLWHMVDAKVLLYIHKEQHLAQIQQAYPSTHYLVVDDKLPILAAMHAQLNERITTVFIQQGHYAHESTLAGYSYRADFSIRHIGELLPIVRELRHR